MAKLWIILAGLLGAASVTIGAYHAHGLEKSLEKRFARGENEPQYIDKSNRLYSKTADKDENGRMSGEEIAAWIQHLMHNCDTAVKYQFYHALAILGIGILLARRGVVASVLLNIAAIAMLVGVAGFSGGLYCVIFDIAKLHWSIVPLGGLAMIVGWLTLVFGGILLQVDEYSTFTPSKPT